MPLPFGDGCDGWYDEAEEDVERLEDCDLASDKVVCDPDCDNIGS